VPKQNLFDRGVRFFEPRIAVEKSVELFPDVKAIRPSVVSILIFRTMATSFDV
jgi:hypothetical protein